MPLGANFENLREHLSDRMISDATLVRGAFRTALIGLGGVGGLGGTLYVPHMGDGRFWISVEQPLEIPANVELHLAPGVTLLPVVPRASGSVPQRVANGIELLGAFRAPIGPVFASLEGFRALGDRARGFNLGGVRFGNRAMERVHPEWWGAAGLGSDDSAALEEAVRAAVFDRWRMIGARRVWLRPLVISLLGTYGLSRPLRIDGSARPAEIGASVEFRGAPGGVNTPSLVCTEGFPLGDVMLSVEGVEAMVLDELRFDGRSRASSCLLLRVPSGEFGARGHLLRRCGFGGATAQDVHILATSAPLTPDAALAGMQRQTLRIEGCTFRPRAGSPPGLLALRIDATSTTDVEIRGSIFDGEAAAMIHARSCSLSVTNTQFHNGLPPDDGDLPWAQREEDLHANGPEGGLDLFLDRQGDDAPATLYAQDCRSTSLQFLATCRRADDDFGRDSTIIALHHVRRASLSSERAGIAPKFIDLRKGPDLDVILPNPAVLAGLVFSKNPTQPALLSALVPSKLVAEQATLLKAQYPKSSGPTPPPADPSPPSPPSPPGQSLPADLAGAAAGTGAPARNTGLEPPALDWRLPATTRARLVLIGCRFDWATSRQRTVARGYFGAAIDEIGVFDSLGTVRSLVLVDGATPGTSGHGTVRRLSDLL